ncbi:cation transporter [Mycobacterium intracellulare]|uniref:Cation transporter n=1 Tax=Mycobacterium intracellulare TaxID=1767 RepID=A0AAE4RL08_MYCIT|nr:cation transporter [Mycobacterium intracellulare]MDV6979295.1 cation transporter [Mycobacterium intracellulare]MDV6984738.1 cation transporter [Mycobacterium intracellulare]MDV7014842.1 cation transporter [Mycobacterium intracellulare]MDV7031021.1 cation transporter [Mycobacterium intracellulare]
MSDLGPATRPNLLAAPDTAVGDHCCATDSCCSTSTSAPVVRDVAWHRAARWARWLAWISLAWMATEGAVGLWQGYDAGSIALIGWALGSAVEGLASLIVVWRFTGSRTLSETSERTAQRAVAISFWLLAPYVAAESMRDLLGDHRSETTVIGMVLTAAALLQMPLLGRAKHKLATKLGSAATAGEGTQNYLCALQAAAVLIELAITSTWSGSPWLDPIIGLGIAVVAVGQGRRAWQGDDCC